MGFGASALARGRGPRVVVQFIAVALLIAIPLVKNLSADSGSSKNKGKGGEVDTCASGMLSPMAMPPMGTPMDLQVTGPCKVPAGNYYYGNVNIFQKKGVATGGILSFNDATIDFWANSILVENKGTLRAGVADDGSMSPVGTVSP